VAGEASRWGGFFSGVELFDAAFFSISPREAKAMDPQHRMLLECAWQVVESACVDPMALKDGKTGVYVGMSSGDYSRRLAEDGPAEFGSTGVASSTAAGRISYVLGVTGAALSIDTACSSSLVSLIYGAKSVERGEEEVALCFGVQALCDGGLFLSFGKAGMLSPDGRCKTFDARANGYVRAEGCGALVCSASKWISNAELGSLVGHAINQDGRSNGLTAPNGPSQVKLILEALGMAGLQGRDVSMLEAHGTGTSLGDPIEVQAVAEAMGQGRERGADW
jgi:acyl transferase domain-containing protein